MEISIKLSVSVLSTGTLAPPITGGGGEPTPEPKPNAGAILYEDGTAIMLEDGTTTLLLEAA